MKMDILKSVPSWVLILVICLPGLTDAACGSNCLKNTSDSSAPACNETTGECLHGCITGYTGLQCQIPCVDNCLNCSISSGSENDTECNQCALNHFKNGGGCELCNDECQGNVSSDVPVCDNENGSCLEGCIDGYYGDKCDIPCSKTCLQNDILNATVCRQMDGYCISGCLDGYYGDQCNYTCSVGCNATGSVSNATCSQDEGHCDFGCVDGYYTAPCNETCSPNCEQINGTDGRICNQTNGHCEHGCSAGYFDSKCDKACSSGCAQNESSNSSVCDAVDGSCYFGCDNSYFLSNCTGNCSPHCLENSTSELRACNESDGHCEFGCEDGYYGLWCDNKCDDNCLENSTSVLPICDKQDGTCTFGCKPQYFKPKCNTKCDNLCVNTSCSRDGVCKGCRYNFNGPRCKGTCSAGCVDNNIDEVPNCHQNGTCKDGCVTHFWGPSCVACNGNCVGNKNKTEEICRESDGFCVQGCKAGKLGITCSDDCPKNCNNSLCNQINGTCLNKCNKGFYGEYCNKTCSTNCLDQGDICFSENGTCVAEECDVSWYGPLCEDKCPRKCMNEVCGRNSGFCSDGCIAGYFGNTCETGCVKGTYGPNCATNCSEGCVNSTCSPDDGRCSECVESFIGAKCDTKVKIPGPAGTDNEPVLSGSIGGAAAVLLILGVVILCCWRKKKKEEIVMRKKPKNRKTFSTIVRQTLFSKSIAGPKRILVDSLLTRVKDMSTTEFETDFNGIEEMAITKSYDEAKKSENLAKNCFMNIYPYDENRVVLHPLVPQETAKDIKARKRKTMDIIAGLTELATMEPGYINASYIEGYASSKQRYIVAQGPIASTTQDFWKMVIQEKATVIVMMTELQDRGVFKKYWPDKGKEDRHGDIHVLGVKEEVFADFCLRTFTLECFGEKRSIKHLQLTSWSGDDSSPPSSAGMIEFYHKFRSIEPKEDIPIIVHCTTGVGQSACFVALDLLVDEGEEDHSVDVSQCVSKLREQRVNMVQSQDQYEFVYKTVAQVLGLRSYPVEKDKVTKELKKMKKDDDKLIHKTFGDIGDSVSMDATDYDSIMTNGAIVGKNREGSDTPEDRYRPLLPNEEYINAVYINTYKRQNGLIMTQMPTPDTVNEFLRLIIQENCHFVVMMNDENLEDTTQCKYWPGINTSTKHGEIFVSTEEIMDRVNYLQIKLSLSDLTQQNDNTFVVTLYQISTWKANSFRPKSEVACLSLIRAVLRETGDSYDGRILVHCLNGSERSGLFCALYILLEKLNYEREISVVNTVRQIRTRRATAIPNLEQFRFIYECLVSYIENYGTEIKYTTEEKEKPSKRSSGSATYAISARQKKKKSSELYAKPDKRKKVKSGDKAGLVNREPVASGSGDQPLYSAVNKKVKHKTDSKGEVSVASGSGDQPLYSAVNKMAKHKTDSKGENPAKTVVDKNRDEVDNTRTESKDTVVAVEDIKDVSVTIDPLLAENPYVEMNRQLHDKNVLINKDQDINVTS